VVEAASNDPGQKQECARVEIINEEQNDCEAHDQRDWKNAKGAEEHE
jgi:hypothetical protein